MFFHGGAVLCDAVQCGFLGAVGDGWLGQGLVLGFGEDLGGLRVGGMVSQVFWRRVGGVDVI